MNTKANTPEHAAVHAIPQVVREALCAKRQAEHHARENVIAATAAVERARETAAEDQAAMASAAAEESAWLARCAKRLAEWDEGGRKGPRPVAAADAGALQRALTAKANAVSSSSLVEKRDAELAAAYQALASAERTLADEYRQAHRATVEELLAERDAHLHLAEEIRAMLIGSQHAEAMFGMIEPFTNLLSEHQLARLDTPPSFVPMSQLFAGRRFVVDISTPIASATDALDIALQPWRQHQAILEAIACGTRTSTDAEAA